MYIDLFDLKLSDPDFGDPYLGKAKCLHIDNGDFDNGRVLSADAVRVCINEIDLRIIMMEYSFESFQIGDLWIANKAYLPYKLRNLLKYTYEQKTLLKGVKNKELEYNHIKGLFNAYYGMMVQNPIKPNYILNENNDLIVDESETIEDLIETYRRKGWLPYQWGVW